MDGSVNASLDSKSRYVVLAYRQSRRTSVWHFVARAAKRDLDDETRITMFSSDLNIRHNVNTLVAKGTNGIKIFARNKKFRT